MQPESLDVTRAVQVADLSLKRRNRAMNNPHEDRLALNVPLSAAGTGGRASVLECGSPLPLFGHHWPIDASSQSAKGLAQSKTSRIATPRA